MKTDPIKWFLHVVLHDVQLEQRRRSKWNYTLLSTPSLQLATAVTLGLRNPPSDCSLCLSCAVQPNTASSENVVKLRLRLGSRLLPRRVPTRAPPCEYGSRPHAGECSFAPPLLASSAPAPCRPIVSPIPVVTSILNILGPADDHSRTHES